jgi:hypothetical protein
MGHRGLAAGSETSERKERRHQETGERFQNEDNCGEDETDGLDEEAGADGIGVMADDGR